MRKRRLAAEEEAEESQSSLVHKYIKRKRLEKGAVDARNRVLQLTYFDIAFWDYFRLGQHSSSSLAELSI